MNYPATEDCDFFRRIPSSQFPAKNKFSGFHRRLPSSEFSDDNDSDNDSGFFRSIPSSQFPADNYYFSGFVKSLNPAPEIGRDVLLYGSPDPDLSPKLSPIPADSLTEGQAEAGGPVPQRACQDLNPSAADSSEMEEDCGFFFRSIPSSQFPADNYYFSGFVKSLNPAPEIVYTGRDVLLYGSPDPDLSPKLSPIPADSPFPPPLTMEQLQEEAATILARRAAAKAARSAAAPTIPRYSEAPSKKKASEAATTSTEGQAEAGGPVPERACQDPNPSAANSSATGSRSN